MSLGRHLGQVLGEEGEERLQTFFLYVDVFVDLARLKEGEDALGEVRKEGERYVGSEIDVCVHAFVCVFVRG